MWVVFLSGSHPAAIGRICLFVAVPDAGCAMRQFGNGSFMMLHNGMQITDRIVFSAI